MQQSWAKSFLTLFLAFLLQSVEAQQSDKIETDRPDQTESPYVVPKKWLQFESGFNYEKDKEGYNTFVHPTLLSKLGLSSRFELRLITEVLTVQSPPIIPFGTVSQTGLLPVQLGGKIALFEEKGARPKTSLIFHTTIPKIASSKFQQEMWGPNFRFTMQHSLSENISLGYNLGAEWDGQSKKPIWIYTIAPGFNLSEKWYAYIEVFGFLNPEDHPQHNMDMGVAYNISKNSKLDISGGWGVSPHATYDHYIALGYSFRVPLSKK